jgi:hypothetical protein
MLKELLCSYTHLKSQPTISDLKASMRGGLVKNNTAAGGGRWEGENVKTTVIIESEMVD